MTAPATARRERRTIPFDYAFRFELTGELDRQHSSTVRVSVEANFVAVAIGYGVIQRREPLRFGLARVEDLDLNPASLATVTAAAAAAQPGAPAPTPLETLSLPLNFVPAGVQGVQSTALALAVAAAAPIVAPAAVAALPAPPPAAPAVPAAPAPPPAPPAPAVVLGAGWPPTLNDFRLSWLTNGLRRTIREETPTSLAQPRPQRQRAADLIEVLTRGVRFNPERLESIMALGANAALNLNDLETLFEEIPPDGALIQFLYRLMDEGTGREFQSDFILNTAGLGIHDGDRPFRQFAVPIVFEPLATIRMDIIEKSLVPGELHVSLHGYRVLGGSGTPTDTRVRR